MNAFTERNAIALHHSDDFLKTSNFTMIDSTDSLLYQQNSLKCNIFQKCWGSMRFTAKSHVFNKYGAIFTIRY